jgi:hypothetical protein
MQSFPLSSVRLQYVPYLHRPSSLCSAFPCVSHCVLRIIIIIRLRVLSLFKGVLRPSQARTHATSLAASRPCRELAGCHVSSRRRAAQPRRTKESRQTLSCWLVRTPVLCLSGRRRSITVVLSLSVSSRFALVRCHYTSPAGLLCAPVLCLFRSTPVSSVSPVCHCPLS